MEGCGDSGCRLDNGTAVRDGEMVRYVAWSVDKCGISVESVDKCGICFLNRNTIISQTSE